MVAIGGVFPVLPTPFTSNGGIDEPGFLRIVDFALDAGVDGIVFPGLASEYDQLSIAERLQLIQALGARTRGRAAFVVGASSAEPHESEALVAAGADAGAVAAMVMTPARYGDDRDALIQFYRALGDAGLPVMLQNAPKPMGIGLSPTDTIAVVAACDHVQWVKEENMPCGQRISALRATAPAHMRGIFGGAGGRYITDELARGAIGTMPAVELPEAHVALMAAHRAGADAMVRVLYEQMLPILMMQAVFRWRLTKEVLRRRGLIASTYTRADGPALDSGDHRELDAVLERLETLTGPMRIGAEG